MESRYTSEKVNGFGYATPFFTVQFGDVTANIFYRPTAGCPSRSRSPRMDEVVADLSASYGHSVDLYDQNLTVRTISDMCCHTDHLM